MDRLLLKKAMNNDSTSDAASILKRRAAALASPVDQGEQREDLLALLEFTLMGMRYAVRLDKVNAVTRVGEICSIPLTPRHISGIIRRRGESIALVSLRHFFHSDAEGIADADFAVIVVTRGRQFALQAEEILGVTHLGRDMLREPPDNFDPAQLPYVLGITMDGLTVLDLRSLVEAPGFGTENPVK